MKIISLGRISDNEMHSTSTPYQEKSYWYRLSHSKPRVIPP